MSLKTTGPPGTVQPTRSHRPPTQPRVRTPARFAAVSLFTLSMMIPLGACSSPEVEQFIADARSQTETIGNDLGEVTTQLPELPDGLRNEVTDAVDSARAATDEARAALAEASATPDGNAALALADAQVALDAASAQVRYVADLAEAAGSDVTDSLRQLQEHLNELRGETSRAGA